jgi:histidinol-phosphate aminotransferase
MWRIGLGAAASAAIPPFAEAQSAASAGTTGWPIELNANGNAFGPSARTIAALREGLALAGRCPDAESEKLRDKIATLHRVKPDQVVLGCGSGEILRMAANAFTGRGRTLVTALPTFGLVSQYAARAGADVAAVHLASNWSHDLQGMLSRCDSTAGLVYICNPNNPTGSLTSRGDLEIFLSRLPASIHVLIDEAYHHYVEQSSDYRSFIDQPVDDGRVIVARSFSKIYGLAGARIGYAIASPRTAALLAAHALDSNVNAIAAGAAAAALDDVEHVRKSRSLNADGRQEFLNQANARMLRAIDSHANFVMMGTEHPVGSIVEQLPVDSIVEHFARNGIVLARAFAPLNRYLRVSLGTAAEMREFWRIWNLMPSHKM